jgi:hypothetical protein
MNQFNEILFKNKKYNMAKCILVQDITNSEESVYNGPKSLIEYSNVLMSEKNITNQILENVDTNELFIYTRVTNAGYIYNSQVKTLLFKLKEVELKSEFDSSHCGKCHCHNNCDCDCHKVIPKPIIREIKVLSDINQDLMDELKRKLNEKFSHKKMD